MGPLVPRMSPMARSTDSRERATAVCTGLVGRRPLALVLGMSFGGTAEEQQGLAASRESDLEAFCVCLFYNVDRLYGRPEICGFIL